MTSNDSLITGRAPASATTTRQVNSTINTSGPASLLHNELDAIIRRRISDTACREALLDCLLRHRSLTGGGWFRIEEQEALFDAVRLNGPVYERDDVRRWLCTLAARSAQRRTNLISRCPLIRNLTAVCIPAADDAYAPGDDASAAGQTAATPLVLISLTTASESTAQDTELMAGQSVVRAWRNWFAMARMHLSADQLLATSAILELVARVNASPGRREAAQTLVNTLHQHLTSRFAALGLKRASAVTARLECVSHAGSFDRNSQQAGRLEAALNETIVRQELTSYPPGGSSDQNQHLAHRRLAETFGVEAVISIPLRNSDDAVTGAILIGGDARTLLSPNCRNTLNACSRPLGTCMAVAEQIEGGVLRRTARRASNAVSQWRGVMTLSLITVAALILCVPVPYRIACRCRAEPVMRRYSLAPYDGMLEDTFVQPGDTVRKGDLLARMEGRELSLELAALTADSERAQKQRDVHMATLAVADALMSELETEKLTTRRQLIRNRLDHLELRSPVDGVVLQGSLERRQHYPVGIGEVLYEIAPLNRIRLETAVAAEERSHIEVGMPVDIRLDGAAGGATVQGKISRIHPRSETRNDHNVFVAEVIVDNPDDTLKPGMEGSARITGHRHTLGWIFGHRFFERLMTKVWW